MNQTGRVLHLPARLENLEAFQQFALEEAQRAGLSPLATGRLELVLEEVLVNIVRYAYALPNEIAPDKVPAQTPQGGRMEIECAQEGPGRIRFVIRDWGPAFDPLAPEEPGLTERLDANREADLDDRMPGGLGLLLLRTLSDAQYRREDDANVLTLRFGGEETDA
jgi:anti-sigma regulatory factor (Ser/Thr protein kinase)